MSYFEGFCIYLDLVFVEGSSKIHSVGAVRCLKKFFVIH